MSETASTLGRPVGSRGEDTRRRIVAATMRCVAEMGYARATIREIARAANVTSSVLYHYFPNKAEIVKAAYVDVSAAAMPGLLESAEQPGGLVHKLVAVMHRGGEIVQEYPYALAFDRAVRAPGVADAELASIGETIFASLRGLVEELVWQAHRDGELNPDVTPPAAAEAVFALMRGLYDHASLATPDQFATTVHAVKLLLLGTLMTGDNRSRSATPTSPATSPHSPQPPTPGNASL
ncbi:TetR/AcrR family transcriptional regulator [Frankia sp. AgB1.9]|nr:MULTISPECIES: TetR/AcrR family transcriptional regulator [unclassified Frankia]MBL7487964.1 TetR/AcrR family transcriptional regulator [Frankia sp. AgW1.1]MBL7550407.1 TetR/AcrR family transcriptional regulator [Frankia sp. AgB1.9]MBL7620877.1 TetR/AcrR family transcriptional regulator [Frankia sp. AgB1.8]